MLCNVFFFDINLVLLFSALRIMIMNKQSSEMKLSRRSLTGIFEFKKPCIICSEHCDIIKDKKHADRWGKNKRLHCKQQTGEMGIYLLKEHYCR